MTDAPTHHDAVAAEGVYAAEGDLLDEVPPRGQGRQWPLRRSVQLIDLQSVMEYCPRGNG